MGVLKISDSSLSKYFKFLKNLDDHSKTKLIGKLKDSIKTKKNSERSISHLYGKWEDDKSAEELISEIRNSRLEKSSIENFE